MVNVVVNAAMMGWGLYLGSRRELLWTLRQRAARAEAEQELRVSQARGTERERIAREMHDVLAHRITQVSMHSGALAFRDDLAADELRAGLTQIQGKANEALHELRGVLGVLRDGSGEPVDQPQPRFADIEEMVVEARRSGMNVTYDDRVDQGEQPVPDAAGRTLYRIVQEGLTNASKHAPGAHVTRRGRAATPSAASTWWSATRSASTPSDAARRRARPHRPRRARRAAGRAARARAAGAAVRAARLDTVDGMTGRPSEPISVLIVDDDALVRSALTLMLGGQRDIHVVGEAGDGAEGAADGRVAAARRGADGHPDARHERARGHPRPAPRQPSRPR